MTDRRSTLDRDVHAVGHRTRLLLAQPRLLLALKTALAAALAYWIAPQIPGTAADYPYYAPLGAVIAMYPTIKTSLRQGFQVLLGVVIGIVLASVVFALQDGPPGVVAVGVLVGIGVVLAGIRRLGAGRDWVLTAGLFVLLLGGADAGSYGLGYIVQLGVGVVVGVVVNFVIVPPLNTSRADERLRRVRQSLADRADEIAGVFETPWPLEDDDWEERVAELPATLRRVRGAVQYADESRHMNPRWLVRRRDLSGEFAELAASERVSFHLQDIAEVSGILGRRIGRQIGMPDSLAPAVAHTIHGVADVIRRHDADTEVLVEARRRIADLWEAVDAHRDRPTTDTSGGVSIAVSLGRIVAALDPDDGTAPRPAETGAEPTGAGTGAATTGAATTGAATTGAETPGGDPTGDAPRDTAPPEGRR